MNAKEYISSGVLESFALGFCSEQEAADVQRMCALHPEVKAELEAIQSALGSYAQAHAVSPKPETKMRFMDAIDALAKEEKATQAPQIKNEPKVIPLATSAPKPTNYLVAASWVLLGLSMVGNIVFYQKWKTANDELVALNSERSTLADQLKVNQVKLADIHRSMDMISDPGVMRVMMKGVGQTPDSKTMVYWNKQTKEVYIEVKELPALASGQQFQLWAIVDGKPVDAGMLPMNDGDSALIRMKDFESAQAFAITIEKEGGNASPTLDKMVVMGAVNG